MMKILNFSLIFTVFLISLKYFDRVFIKFTMLTSHLRSELQITTNLSSSSMTKLIQIMDQAKTSCARAFAEQGKDWLVLKKMNGLFGSWTHSLAGCQQAVMHCVFYLYSTLQNHAGQAIRNPHEKCALLWIWMCLNFSQLGESQKAESEKILMDKVTDSAKLFSALWKVPSTNCLNITMIFSVFCVLLWIVRFMFYFNIEIEVFLLILIKLI